MDTSNNKSIYILLCGNCGLSNIDVSENRILRRFTCCENPLTSLDVSYNDELEELYCYDCSINNLDVSANQNLKYLSCYDNNMTSLDVSKNKNLTMLYCWGNKFSTVNLASLERDNLECDADYSKPKYTIRYSGTDKTLYIKNEPDTEALEQPTSEQSSSEIQLTADDTKQSTNPQPATTSRINNSTKTEVTSLGKANLTSTKNNKKKTVTVKWKTVKGAKGYEVQYALNKTFTKSKKTKTTSKTSLTIKSLKKQKTYYVRVRAYKLNSKGKKIYGKWSTVKKVVIKR